MKKVLIVGSGGVGTIAALGLELGGKASVTSVVRSDYAVVSENGFQIDSIDHGVFSNWKPSKIAKSIQEAAEMDSYDYILVCTKVLPELYKSEELIEPAVTEGKTVIVLMQNGIDIEKPVAAKYPQNVVLSGVSMIGSINHHGKVHQEEPDRCQVGYYESPGFSKQELENIAKQFVGVYGASGVKCVYAPHLLTSRWRKLVYNSCINTVCAATVLDAGRVYLGGLDQTLVMPAMQEIKKLAKIALKSDEEDPLGKDIDIEMLESDDGIYYKPSMLVDVEKGNPIELEAILGNPLRIAKELGVETPVLSTLYSILKGIQFRLLEGKGHIVCPTEGASRAKHARIFDP